MKDYINMDISWVEIEHVKRYFKTVIDGQVLLLRINDLIEDNGFDFICGDEIIPLNKMPESWALVVNDP